MLQSVSNFHFNRMQIQRGFWIEREFSVQRRFDDHLLSV